MKLWNQLRILFWRPVCWIRKTHRAKVLKILASRVDRRRKICLTVCIHCGYSMEADISQEDLARLLDPETDTLMLGSRAQVPLAKRIRWLLADLGRVQ